jgi:MOSC domain-containing protein YiiM
MHVTAGTVLEIFTTPSASEPMVLQSEVVALAGKGLEGDRYAAEIGFYSSAPITAGGRELTLIDLRAIEEVAEQTGLPFSTVECRRNLITSGVDLDALIGKAFTVGLATCEGVRACPPCVHLEELTGKKVMKALARTGGLRARIVSGGRIRVGDPIEVVGPATGPSVSLDA